MEAGKEFIHQGTSRPQRLHEFAATENLRVDEQTTGSLLSFLASYSLLINYYNLENQAEGTWEGFFISDILVVLACISEWNISEKIQEREHCKTILYSDYAADGDKSRAVQQLLESSFKILSDINHWDKAISKLSAKNPFKTEWDNAVSNSLHRLLKELHNYMEQYGMKVPGEIYVRRFSRFSLHTGKRNEGEKYIISEGDYIIMLPAAQAMEKLLEDILDISSRSLKVSGYLAEIARKEFKRQIHTPDHQPHIALLVAFLKLYEYPQQTLNKVPARLRDFYFQEVLKGSPHHMEPDYVHIGIEPNSTTEGFMLPANTLLNAGKDNASLPVHYSTMEDTWISHTKLAALYTLFLEKDPVLEEIYGENFIASATISEPAHTIPVISPWPVLGDKNQDDPVQKTRPAEFGFAVSSSSLFLKDGNRYIELSFLFTPGSFAQFMQSLPGDDPILSFRKIFHEAFIIHYTGPAGWVPVKEYNVHFRQDTHSILIHFSLEAGEVAFTGFNASLHGTGYSPDVPVVKLMLAQGSWLFAYSFFRKLEISSVNIRTVVNDISLLTLQNENGKIDPRKPFSLLGVTPAKGSYLDIGYPELAHKKIMALSVNIQWRDLPAEGFEKYYEGYGIPVNNDSFRVSFSRLSNRKWELIPDARNNYPLFFSLPSQTALSTESLFPITPGHAFFLPEGSLRMVLTAPDTAFAHHLYTNVLARTVIENSRKKTAMQNLPAKPFTPVCQHISLSYTAEDTVHPGRQPESGKIFRIHPFGMMETAGDEPLLPLFESEGHIFMGFTAEKDPGQLSLLFQLISSPDEDHGPGELEWSYLSGDTWKKFPGKSVSDTTDGFSNPGIVRIIFPHDATLEHTIMPGGMYWIKIEKARNAASMGKMAGIFLNALKAVYTSGSALQAAGRSPVLAPGSIKKTEKLVHGIQKIIQPFASFGGKQAESAESFRLRFSERLHHKQRAILPWDYERLVLQEFPFLFKVSCIGRMYSENIKLVVIPFVQEGRPIDRLKPRLSAAGSEEIKTYISPLASPFARLEVQSPLYETIQVRCTVIFEPVAGEHFHALKLNEELIYYLSPWLGNQAENVEIGNRFSISELMHFIETRPYVQQLTGLIVVKTLKAGEAYEIYNSKDEKNLVIAASTPWSVFTSAPEHIIEESELVPEPVGIGNLTIDENFIVTKKDHGIKSASGISRVTEEEFPFQLDIEKLLNG